jgi:hypothetical protein
LLLRSHSCVPLLRGSNKIIWYRYSLPLIKETVACIISTQHRTSTWQFYSGGRRKRWWTFVECGCGGGCCCGGSGGPRGGAMPRAASGRAGHTSIIHLSSPSPSSMTMASSTRRTDILSLIHIRSDGRRPHEIRHMSCHLGALPSTNCGSALPTSACSGSALVTMGLTQVICVVRGPCDIGRRNDELPDRYDSNACSLFLFMP